MVVLGKYAAATSDRFVITYARFVADPVALNQTIIAWASISAMVDPVILVMEKSLRDSTAEMRRDRKITAIIPITITNGEIGYAE